jgi:hypothetical protein
VSIRYGRGAALCDYFVARRPEAKEAIERLLAAVKGNPFLDNPWAPVALEALGAGLRGVTPKLSDSQAFGLSGRHGAGGAKGRFPDPARRFRSATVKVG